jgi:hypothetical protein
MVRQEVWKLAEAQTLILVSVYARFSDMYIMYEYTRSGK